MADDFKDKARSIAFPRKMGQKEKVDVVNEDTGGVGGYHVKHWDGRQDAHITPAAATATGEAKVALAEALADEEGN